MDSVKVTRWSSAEPLTEAALKAILQAEGLGFYAWSNGPHDVYAAHSHEYSKVIYCLSGSITFGSPGEDRQVTLYPGDRLDLPAGTVHDAVVGSQGVVCLEAHI
ncbi:MAG: cupin domain-containing protein [Anaerolineae bacterium]